jgi:hypothetical protein
VESRKLPGTHNVVLFMEASQCVDAGVARRRLGARPAASLIASKTDPSRHPLLLACRSCPWSLRANSVTRIKRTDEQHLR